MTMKMERFMDKLTGVIESAMIERLLIFNTQKQNRLSVEEFAIDAKPMMIFGYY